MEGKSIIGTKDLGFQWETNNPFLFCVHHLDAYPRGNAEMGPDASLAGRSIGNDFIPHEGWRMYHGKKIPGFPVHPHRGFETVTIVLKGFVDHADFLGAAGRYGQGDVQWMTAGAGIQHAEMFPMLNQDKENSLELFQIWLNLPAANKFVDPYYKMLWSEDIPKLLAEDSEGRSVEVTIVAGAIGDLRPPAPPPDSWAARNENDLAIWLIKMEPFAKWNIPPALKEVSRSLYFNKGSSVVIADMELGSYKAVDLHAGQELILENGSEESHLLLLQGRPIAEKAVRYGPFVMNSEKEIQQAIDDYRRTEFGGWPWPRPDMVHERSRGRFAKYADGNEEDM